MIGFIAPAALAGLVLALGPLLIHLLQRRQARRAVVPTVRFVPAVSHSALRLRTPDDVLLLVLRTAAVAAAVLALAGPVILTAARTAAWNDRIVRAVVVDTSASATAARDRTEVATAVEGAHASRRIEADHLREGLTRAAAWLETAPPGRREVVVVSDFQHGALRASDLSLLPVSAGVRFVRSGPPSPPGVIDRGVEYYDGLPHQREVMLDGWSTALTLTRRVEREPGLRIEGATDDQAARLERIVREAGAVSSRPDATVIVRFGMPDDQRGTRADGPAARALLRLLATEATGNTGAAENTERREATGNTGNTGNTGAAGNTERREATGNTENTENTESNQNTGTARLGVAAFSARAEGDTLVVTTSADPSSFEAAQLVHAAVVSWRDPEAYAEGEIQTIGHDTLTGWTREAAPADVSGWRRVDSTDARWFWGLALLCLGAEWIVRRRAPGAREGHARAA